MMYFKRVFGIVTLILFVTVSVFAQSQQQPQSEGQQLYQEYIQINQQVQQIQQQAMADEDIQNMTQEFSDKLEAAIVEENPELQSAVDKKNELIDQFEKAQQAGDQEQLQQISQDYEAVNQELQPAQQQIMQQEEFRTEAQEIETAVMAKMEEINPETPQLLAKMNELRTKLQQMQGQQ